MIEAVIFDFDGLVIETETPLYNAWRRAFQERGVDLDIERWIEVLGRSSVYFDFPGHLEELSGQPVDRDALQKHVRTEALDVIEQQPILPGVTDRLDEIEAMGLFVGLCSGSSREWIAGHLGRLGLLSRFPERVCRDDTVLHKPEPAPYLKTAERLGVEPSRCLVFEDSPNGVNSAKAAGMLAVAVPTEMTRNEDFSAADLVVGSLAELTLAEMLNKLVVPAEE